MDGQPLPARFRDFARTGFAFAVWFGVVDAVQALRSIDPLTDRIVTMAVALTLDGLLLGLGIAFTLAIAAS